MSSNKQLFEAAVDHVQSLPPKGPVQLSNDQKLSFYALFKQAKTGACSGSAPSRLKVVERAKYEAWKQLGSMSQEEACKTYIEQLAKLDPKWKVKADKLRSKL